MTQAVARMLAKALSSQTGKTYVAKTEAQHRGQFDGPNEEWIVVDFNDPRDIIRQVPETEGIVVEMLGHVERS